MPIVGVQLELIFEPRSRQDAPTSKSSYRATVLAVIDRQTEPMKAKDVADFAGLTYRQTVDALNALYNLGKIDRIGRKFTALWSRKRSEFTVAHGLNALERHFLGLR